MPPIDSGSQSTSTSGSVLSVADSVSPPAAVSGPASHEKTAAEKLSSPTRSLLTASPMRTVTYAQKSLSNAGSSPLGGKGGLEAASCAGSRKTLGSGGAARRAAVLAPLPDSRSVAAAFLSKGPSASWFCMEMMSMWGCLLAKDGRSLNPLHALREAAKIEAQWRRVSKRWHGLMLMSAVAPLGPTLRLSDVVADLVMIPLNLAAK